MSYGQGLNECQGPWRNIIEKLVTKFGQEVCGQTSINGSKKKKKDICISCECSSKGDLSRGGF